MANEIMTLNINNELSMERTTSYSSIAPTTKGEKKRLFNAMNNPDANVSDFINKSISLVDVFVEPIEVTNGETGEIEYAPRIVLIDKAGKSYQCVSKGMLGALKSAFFIYGEPTEWDEPLEITIKQVSVGKGSMLTFDVK